MAEGCDYSWSRPTPTCLYQHGIRWVGRYLLTADPSKSLSRAEADQLAAAGLWIVSIYQPSGKTWMLGGYQTGVNAAKDAVKVGGACGMPTDRPFTYALDTDTAGLSSAQWQAVKDCLRGAASVHGIERTGVYGDYDAIRELMPDYARWGYQTYAWSGGLWHGDAQIQQYHNDQGLCGGTIDYCRSTTGDYGQWQPGISAAAGGATTDSAADTKTGVLDALTEFLRDGIIPGQNRYADHARVDADRLAKILAEQQQTNILLERLVDATTTRPT